MSLIDEFGALAERYLWVYRDTFGRDYPVDPLYSDAQVEAAARHQPLLLDPEVRALYQGFPIRLVGWLEVVALDDPFNVEALFRQDIAGSLEHCQLAGTSWEQQWGLWPGDQPLVISDSDTQVHLVSGEPGATRVLSYQAGYSDYPRCTVCAPSLLAMLGAVVAMAETGQLEAVDNPNMPAGELLPPDPHYLGEFTDILDEYGVNEDIYITGWAPHGGRAAFPHGNRESP